MRIQVLGSLRVWHGADDEVDLGPPARRAVLGLLALAGGEPVPRAELIDALWGEEPPPSAVNVIQTHVKHLRRLLEPNRPTRARSGVLPHARGGYALHVDAGQADLPRFRRLVAEAHAAEREGRVPRVAELLGEALRLWRGRPVADVPVLASHPRVAGLEAERWAAFARYGEAMIASGAAGGVLPELVRAAAEQPLDEPTHARLIRAYHALDRRAEAFEAYDEVRGRLAEQLGVDPGPELTAARAALLRDRGARGATGSRGVRPSPPVPRQLPPDIPGFTGRSVQLAALNRLVSRRDGTGASALVTISGSAGAGKSALAVHWARRVSDRFPDGQLYASLRGHTPGPPAAPVEVLGRFLLALGVPAERVPDDLETAAALYRTLLTDRRVLVLLDDAAAPGQVRPLLPGGSGCVVVVTGRERMLGLVAVDGALEVTLPVMSPAEALDLLARVLGQPRVSAEPGAAAELARLCACLPLALRIAAAHLVSQPGRPLAEHAAALRRGSPLAALAVPGDERAAVRAAFDLSYAALPAQAQRLFRLLGLVPGADCTAPAAAALADLDEVAAARALLERLLRASLVEQPAGGRYRFHDLLRHYAAEMSGLRDSAADREAARRRLYDWYLRGADQAARALYPHMLRLPPSWDGAAPAGGGEAPDRTAASGWLDAERGNLVAAVRHQGAPRPAAWLLADTLRGHFWLGMHKVDWLAAAQAALAAAEAAGEARAQAAARLSLGDLHLRLSRYRQAVGHYAHALRLARRAGWEDCHAAVLSNLGCVYYQSGRLTTAVARFRRALALCERTGQRAGQATALGNLVLVYWEKGELRQAAEHCARALALYRAIGSRYGEAISLGNLGRVQHALGLPDEATASLTAALGMHREAGDRYGETDARTYLAAALRDTGDHRAALAQARAALALARDIGDPRAEAEAQNALASVQHRLGRRPEALRGHRLALEAIRASGDRYPECEALLGLAEAGGDAVPAEQALALAAEAGYRAVEGHARTVLAGVAMARGRPAEAVAQARQAVAIHRETGHRRGACLALLTLGHGLLATQDAVRARACWQEALRVGRGARLPEAARVAALLDGLVTA